MLSTLVGLSIAQPVMLMACSALLDTQPAPKVAPESFLDALVMLQKVVNVDRALPARATLQGLGILQHEARGNSSLDQEQAMLMLRWSPDNFGNATLMPDEQLVHSPHRNSGRGDAIFKPAVPSMHDLVGGHLREAFLKLYDGFENRVDALSEQLRIRIFNMEKRMVTEPDDFFQCLASLAISVFSGGFASLCVLGVVFMVILGLHHGSVPMMCLFALCMATFFGLCVTLGFVSFIALHAFLKYILTPDRKAENLLSEPQQ